MQNITIVNCFSILHGLYPFCSMQLLCTQSSGNFVTRFKIRHNSHVLNTLTNYLKEIALLFCIYSIGYNQIVKLLNVYSQVDCH